MKRKVVIITDCTDVALMEIRGIIHTYAANENYEIEPVVKVENYSIVNTAFLVLLVADTYPEGTIINVVVNPLKERTERIFGRLRNKDIIFEGTNTGAFGWLIEKYGCTELYEIFDPGFVPFGGKYVHAPTVGKLIGNEPFDKLGHTFALEKVRKLNMVDGLVFHVDNFGNVKFYAGLEGKDGDVYSIQTPTSTIKAIYRNRMMEGEDGQLIIYPGSSFGYPELGIVRGDASKILNVSPGDIIKISKVNEI